MGWGRMLTIFFLLGLKVKYNDLKTQDGRQTAKHSLPSPGDRNSTRNSSPHSFSARPFPLPSFPFNERAWIFDLPAKKETVLQSRWQTVQAFKLNVLTFFFKRQKALSKTYGKDVCSANVISVRQLQAANSRQVFS